jgi:hypothetical protein
MPALKSTDPLVPLPVRVRRSTLDELSREADVTGITVSDLVRVRLNHPGEPARNSRRPTKREVKVLAPPSGDDPYLVSEKARIKNNLNQLARAVNARNLAGSPIEPVEVLVALSRIEQRIDELLKGGRERANAH